MTTSVPRIVSDQKYRDALAKLVEMAFEAYRLSGNIKYLKSALEPVNEYYNLTLKPAHNRGDFPFENLENYRKAIEKIEDGIRNHERGTL